jgi:hypothetical protein
MQGASASAGTIFGSAWSGTLTGGIVGGVTGAVSSVMFAITHNIFAGPVGWLVLGATHDQASETSTFDCWKPVLHQKCSEPSNGKLNGKLLRDVVTDDRIKHLNVNDSSSLPEIIVHNIWDDQFLIQYLTFPTKQMALHALRLN